MKRRHVDKVGNFFMGLGLVVMISGEDIPSLLKYHSLIYPRSTRRVPS